MRVLTASAALTAVFEPRRVALVGASDRPGTAGRLFWDNLASFPGEVVPVTPSAAEVGGHRSVPTLRDIDGDVDLAVVVTPAPAVAGVIADAAAKGIPAAVVISGGFAEAGPEGVRWQDEVLAAARAGGVRIIGPNCFGVQNCDLGLNASLATGLPEGGGGISLVTQSGSYGMAVHTLAADERTRFAKVCATGNKADLADAELLRYLGSDPATRTLCFLSESLPDGRAFVDAAREITPHKPVIVTRTGRSLAGARAAFSHTAALATHQRLARAALEQAGATVVGSGLEMLDAARALDTQPQATGARVGIITNSGGTGVELTDLLSEEGLSVPELSAGLVDELRPLLPTFAGARNPVDITPVWRRFTELYPAMVDRLARSGEVDVVIPVLLQRAADEAVAAAVLDAVAALRADGVTVPVYVCWVAPRADRAGADLLQEAGVPCFDWPERTARAVAHAVRYAVARTRPPRHLPQPRGFGPLPALPEGALDIERAAELLTAAGIELLPGRVCASAREAVAAAEDLGYPVVGKAVHPELVHKSDVGGVRLGLADVAAVAASADDLLALAPGARVLVQRQGTGVEVVVGGLRDPQFGAGVLVGLGGAFVEVLDDVALGLAPLSEEHARDLLGRLRGYPLLAGARGREPVDLAALARLVTRIGDLLVAVPAITELDLNPVLCDAAGCVAADWRVKGRNRSSQDEVRATDSPGHGGEMGAFAP
ncbi:MAG: acetate--CoA ligase family protein [Haloechinothrix sp.]